MQERGSHLTIVLIIILLLVFVAIPKIISAEEEDTCQNKAEYDDFRKVDFNYILIAKNLLEIEKAAEPFLSCQKPVGWKCPPADALPGADCQEKISKEDKMEIKKDGAVKCGTVDSGDFTIEVGPVVSFLQMAKYIAGLLSDADMEKIKQATIAHVMELVNNKLEEKKQGVNCPCSGCDVGCTDKSATLILTSLKTEPEKAKNPKKFISNYHYTIDCSSGGDEKVAEISLDAEKCCNCEAEVCIPGGLPAISLPVACRYCSYPADPPGTCNACTPGEPGCFAFVPGPEYCGIPSLGSGFCIDLGYASGGARGPMYNSQTGQTECLCDCYVC